jgi:hypothetical protein
MSKRFDVIATAGRSCPADVDIEQSVVLATEIVHS